MAIACCIASPLLEAMNTRPSSSMSIWAPVSSTILRIILPPGPITSRILSGLIWTVSIRGAHADISVRGAGRLAKLKGNFSGNLTPVGTTPPAPRPTVTDCSASS